MFSAQYPKRYCKSSPCGPFEAYNNDNDNDNDNIHKGDDLT